MRRLLIIGCGEVALRAVPQLCNCYRSYALTHSRERAPLLRAQGILPIMGDLDDAASLNGPAGITHEVLHCAPPPNHGMHDTRTTHLVAALANGKSLPQQPCFMNESRRLSNRRVKQELRFKFLHPTVRDGIDSKCTGAK